MGALRRREFRFDVVFNFDEDAAHKGLVDADADIDHFSLVGGDIEIINAVEQFERPGHAGIDLAGPFDKASVVAQLRAGVGFRIRAFIDVLRVELEADPTFREDLLPVEGDLALTLPEIPCRVRNFSPVTTS